MFLILAIVLIACVTGCFLALTNRKLSVHLYEMRESAVPLASAAPSSQTIKEMAEEVWGSVSDVVAAVAPTPVELQIEEPEQSWWPTDAGAVAVLEEPTNNVWFLPEPLAEQGIIEEPVAPTPEPWTTDIERPVLEKFLAPHLTPGERAHEGDVVEIITDPKRPKKGSHATSVEGREGATLICRTNGSATTFRRNERDVLSVLKLAA